MERSIEGGNRRRATLLPETPDDYVNEDIRYLVPFPTAKPR